MDMIQNIYVENTCGDTWYHYSINKLKNKICVINVPTPYP